MFRTFVSSIRWRILSFPIFLKIIGIGIITAMLFGAVTLLQTRATTSDILYQLLEQKTIAMGHSLADTLERPTSTGDYYAISRHLKEAQKSFPEIRYIIVRSHNEKVIASTFESGIPPDLSKISSPLCPPKCTAKTIGSDEGIIMDISTPIAGGYVGFVQLGVLDHIVTRELDSLRNRVLWALFLCAAIGIAYAFMLTGILTKPIRHLVQAANKIREGQFATRATVFSNDEIGRLAVAFNQMAEALMQYRQEVQAKEKARLSLIERTVQIQEDERKSISRELHDHFGQSLLALLLQVQSGCKYSPSRCARAHFPDSLCFHIEDTIRKIIEEVHRLAWGMRPSILDDYGLESALARHIGEVIKTARLEIDYQFLSPDGLKRLPIGVEVSLYRIAQEATTNIIKHAKASHASFVVLRQIHEVTMLIEDNGQGFDFAAANEKGDQCLGLLGMRERVNLLGGSFVIESAPGEGTTIRVRIPLAEDSNANTDLHSG
ncbi:MAG TPA: sensor histidine kinase [Acidobacteriota bacterium]|nr:sensor histidine kinase [Acidobacteriota bacterium]